MLCELRGIFNIAAPVKDFKHLIVMRTTPKSLSVDEILASAEGSFAFVLSCWRIAGWLLQAQKSPSQVTLDSSVRPSELLKTCIRNLLKCSWGINSTENDFTESVKSRPSLSVLWSLEHQPFPSMGFGNKQLFSFSGCHGPAAATLDLQKWVKIQRELHYLTYREIIVSFNRQ